VVVAGHLDCAVVELLVCELYAADYGERPVGPLNFALAGFKD
jgi:hypothetical protein